MKKMNDYDSDFYNHELRKVTSRKENLRFYKSNVLEREFFYDIVIQKIYIINRNSYEVLNASNDLISVMINLAGYNDITSYHNISKEHSIIKKVQELEFANNFGKYIYEEEDIKDLQEHIEYLLKT